MRVRSKCENVSILCGIFLTAATISCNNQSQLDKKNQEVQTKIDTKLLKFTTGVRSILEDSKGNIWFELSEFGVWRYDGRSMKNFTIGEDGLESKHIWLIYKSKRGELWLGGASPSGVFRFNGKSFERIY